jgi:hypothetical protein
MAAAKHPGLVVRGRPAALALPARRRRPHHTPGAWPAWLRAQLRRRSVLPPVRLRRDHPGPGHRRPQRAPAPGPSDHRGPGPGCLPRVRDAAGGARLGYRRLRAHTGLAPDPPPGPHVRLEGHADRRGPRGDRRRRADRPVPELHDHRTGGGGPHLAGKDPVPAPGPGAGSLHHGHRVQHQRRLPHPRTRHRPDGTGHRLGNVPPGCPAEKQQPEGCCQQPANRLRHRAAGQAAQAGHGSGSLLRPAWPSPRSPPRW